MSISLPKQNSLCLFLSVLRKSIIISTNKDTIFVQCFPNSYNQRNNKTGLLITLQGTKSLSGIFDIPESVSKH